MAFLYPRDVIHLQMEDLAVLTVADGKDVMTVPCDMEIFYIRATIQVTGTTSGNNDYVLEAAGTDLWTIGTGVGRIAYNASVRYQEFTRDSMSTTKIKAGQALKLNINAVAGAGSPAGLVVHIFGYPLND